MTNKEIAVLRLYNQRIGSPAQQPPEVVNALGALQAQDYMQAVWALGLRTRSSSLSEVEEAIAGRNIILTWSIRGTLHFAPPEDVKWMIQLSAPRLLKAAERQQAQLELDHVTLERCRKIIYNALRGGRCISRPDLLQRLEDEGIRTTGQRGYHILWHCAYNGLICFGPISGKQQTFVLLEEWMPGLRQLSFGESVAELARRYFISHGPATVHDFAWWSGLTLSDARTGLAAAGGQLVSYTTGGCEYWMPKPPAALPAGSSVHLLPGFDEVILGYKDRSAVLSPKAASLIVPGNNGVFLPTIALDGQVVGTWKRNIKQKGAELTLIPFEIIERRVLAKVKLAAEQYAAFLGVPLTKLEVE